MNKIALHFEATVPAKAFKQYPAVCRALQAQADRGHHGFSHALYNLLTIGRQIFMSRISNSAPVGLSPSCELQG